MASLIFFSVIALLNCEKKGSEITAKLRLQLVDSDNFLWPASIFSFNYTDYPPPPEKKIRDINCIKLCLQLVG